MLKGDNQLQTTTTLHPIIDNFIFNCLNAVYKPDHQRFEYNLHLNEQELLQYLGTYFPRSYAEAFCIFDNIFENGAIRNIYESKQIVNILSIGCGTGGDILGLIFSINKHFPNIRHFNIIGFDGNKEAFKILMKIIDTVKNHTNLQINFLPMYYHFYNLLDFESKHISNISFDFIISFKFISEIIALGKGKLDNSYYDFIKKFLPLLSKTGICVVLDITTKQRHRNLYNPQFMNEQINKALNELFDYSTIIPISCGTYGQHCSSQCFQQKLFFVSHSRCMVNYDRSKVAYRVIVSRKLKETLPYKVNNNCKLIVTESGFTKYCSHTMHFDKQADAYLLNTGMYTKFEDELDF